MMLMLHWYWGFGGKNYHGGRLALRVAETLCSEVHHGGRLALGVAETLRSEVKKGINNLVAGLRAARDSRYRRV
eukprot:scaffold47039_cov62-Cyclotella_meneghiniana.AAC.1